MTSLKLRLWQLLNSSESVFAPFVNEFRHAEVDLGLEIGMHDPDPLLKLNCVSAYGRIQQLRSAGQSENSAGQIWFDVSGSEHKSLKVLDSPNQKITKRVVERLNNASSLSLQAFVETCCLSANALKYGRQLYAQIEGPLAFLSTGFLGCIFQFARTIGFRFPVQPDRRLHRAVSRSCRRKRADCRPSIPVRFATRPTDQYLHARLPFSGSFA